MRALVFLLICSATPALAAPPEPGAAPELAALPEPDEPEATPPEAARVVHVPPVETRGGEPLRVVAVIRHAWTEDGLVLRYRPAGAAGYADAPFERSTAGGYHATIPASAVGRPGVEYYIAGVAGGRAHFASADAPHLVRVEPAADARWIEVERRRLGGRVHGIALRLEARDFGDTHGADRHLRGEIDWTYRLVSTLYSVSRGYGFLEGETPSAATDDAVVLQRGGRWGYGGVRLRLRESMWLDARAILGLADDGFSAGVGGQLILGDDWRTAVMLGAETLGDLRHRAWITLQWDTVPPFLMRATAAATDQPASGIEGGSYIEYEIRYPIVAGTTLAAALQFGARGNRPGGFGGALSMHYDF